MSKLKELTWANHQKAERTNHASKLLRGMTPEEYHRYIYNQYVMYAVLESKAKEHGVLEGIEDICRADAIRVDMEELETAHRIQRNGDLLCQVVADYTDYVMHMEDKEEFLAHIYVRHFGDMYGGQMIKKRNPGSGKMYEFDNVEQLKTTVRSMLTDDMADEANTCFEFAMQLFEELDNE
jgi:heme oxygenase